MASEKKRVVILGAGYGGLYTALRLERLFKHGEHQIVLVDQNNYHQLTTELHEAAAGRTSFNALSIPMTRILKDKRIDFLNAKVTRIDFPHQTVTTTKGEITYDKLVIALGSQTEFFGIPGLREHAFTLTSLEDAQRIKHHVRRMFVQAEKETDASKRRAMLTFVVGGGGFTGTELATELADQVYKLAEEFMIARKETCVVVLEAADSILSGFDLKLVNRAVHVVKSKGIKLMLKTPVVRVDANKVQLKTSEEIFTRTLIWTGGVRAHDLVAGSGLKCGSRGRAVVNPFLESVNYPGVYIIGDSSLVLDPQTSRPLAPTAQLALQQAEFAAANIYAEIKGLKRIRYVPRVRGQIVSLGGRDAVGWIGRIRIVGFAAWLLKRTIVWKHLYSIGGVKLLMEKLPAILAWSGDC